MNFDFIFINLFSIKMSLLHFLFLYFMFFSLNFFIFIFYVIFFKIFIFIQKSLNKINLFLTIQIIFIFRIITLV